MIVFYNMTMSKLVLGVYVLVASMGLILFKLGSNDDFAIRFDERIHIQVNRWILLGLFFYAVSFCIYMYLISQNDLSYIIPVTTALLYIVIFFASYFIFKEALTAVKITGIVLILGGLVLLNLK